MTKYNGWTNYATWRVNLEMFDGLDPDDMGWSDLEVYDLATALKEYATDALELETPSNGSHMPLALSYALAFLEDVNWREIAAHMLDAHADA